MKSKRTIPYQCVPNRVARWIELINCLMYFIHLLHSLGLSSINDEQQSNGSVTVWRSRK